MAITYVGSASAASTSVSLPTFQAGDVALVVATSASMATPVTVPAGWTTISAASNGACGWRVLQPNDTSVGTWTNATAVGVIVYRGVSQVWPLGNGSAANVFTGSTGAVSAQVFTPRDPTEMLVCMGITSGATDIRTASTASTTNRTSGLTATKFGAFDCLGGVSSLEEWTYATTTGVNAAVLLQPATTYPFVADGDTTSGTVTSNSSSWTLTYPTNIGAGDLLVALIACDGSAIPTSGMSSWGINYRGSGANELTVALMAAAGTETGTFAVGLSASEQGSWVIYRIPAGTWSGNTVGSGNTDLSSGQHNLPAYATAAATSASLNPDPPSVDPSEWATANTLWFAVMSADTSRTVSAYPSSPDTFTNTGSLVSGGSNGATLGWARLEQNAASVDPGTFTISNSDDWVAATIAVRPYSSGSFPVAAWLIRTPVATIAVDAVIKATVTGYLPTIQSAPVNSGSDYGIGSSTQRRVAQAFTTPVGTSILLVVDWYPSRVLSPSDSVRVVLYSDSAGLPGAAIQTLGTALGSSLPTATTKRTIYPNLAVSSETTYWLVFERTGSFDDTNYYRVAMDLVTGFSGLRAIDSSGTWSSSTSSDFTFRAWTGAPLRVDAVITGGGGPTTVPGSTTANAILFKTLAPTTTTNAVLFKNSGTKTTTLDAILRKTITPVGGFGAASWKFATIASSATANAVLRKTITPTGGTKADAIKREIFSPTFAASAALRKTLSFGPKADAVLFKAQASSTTANAVRLANSGTRTSSADAIRLVTIIPAGGFAAAAWKFATLAGSLTADAVRLAGSGTLATTAQAITKVIQTVGPKADAVLFGSATGAASVDAVLFKNSGTKTVVADAILLADSGLKTFPVEYEWTSGQVTHSFDLVADAVVSRAVGEMFLANAAIHRVGAGGLTTDAIVLETRAGSTTASAALAKAGAGSFSVSAALRRLGSGSLALDAVLAKTLTGSLTVDAIRWRLALAGFVQDAIIGRTTVGSPPSDAVLLATLGGSLELLAVKAGIFSLDARFAGIFSLDAFLSSGKYGFFVADAWVAGPVYGANQLDAIILGTASGAIQTDAVVLATLAGGAPAAAIVMRETPGTFSTDAVLRASASGALELEAIKHETLAGSTTGDAITLATAIDDALAEAWVQAVIVLAVDVDAHLEPLWGNWSETWDNSVGISTVGGSFSLDAALAASSTSSLSLEAVLLASTLGSAPVDAISLVSQANDFDVAAVVIASRTSDYRLDAVTRATIATGFPLAAVKAGIFDVAAWLAGSFALDAFIRAGQYGFFTADAWLAGPVYGATSVDAVLARSAAGSATLDAITRATVDSSATVDASLAAPSSGAFSLQAIVKASRSATIPLGAVALATVVPQPAPTDALLKTAIQASLGVEAITRATRMVGSATDAVLLSPQGSTFGAAAELGLAHAVASALLDATIRATITAGLPASASLLAGRSGALTLDATTVGATTGLFRLDANITGAGVAGFSIAAVLAASSSGSYGLDASISPLIPVKIGATWSAATISASMTAGTIGATMSASGISSSLTAATISWTPILARHHLFSLDAEVA